MKNRILFVAILSCMGSFAQTDESKSPANSKLKAFPTAYGGGAFATGGRGGHVYHVTHLQGDTSVGSFRWALSRPRPATIVFDGDGYSDLEEFLNLVDR